MIQQAILVASYHIQLSSGTRNQNFSLHGFFCNFEKGPLGPLRLGKLAWQTPKLGNLL